ncbi:AMP-dependent synthetase/ligase [Gordonia sihwensis]|uniref:Acyl-CoA synthetase n=1 Tax=Gordonia sihwensis NBRC 108236 TaxID=1223544 RepID=L7LIW6_9ACTN|nr:long-chain fatty acid--CoA ligase [Gordonia sihwensis]KJR05529.1 long-chain fatty acid--CoA ligase [Gordonia sihwensis]MBY4571339.1 long-chain fatty acid--CoA ligase [Gordonia sihwensis]GAC59983.1 long-chain fatty-acid--CoA ligase FadD [Gordonia sihwensis NBRC 108236]
MAECRVPAKFQIPEERNASDVLFDIVEKQSGKTVFRRQSGSQWLPVTAAEAGAQVTAIAKGLIASGIEPGDRVALVSATRLEWTLLDFAIWSAGAITVPVYDSSSGPQIDWIMRDSGATAIIAETAGHRAVIDTVESVDDSVQVFQIDVADGPGVVELLTERGKDVADEEVHARRRTLKASSPATLIYTSGTTGRPKGCMLTHSNLLGEIAGVMETPLNALLGDGKRLLLFLPMAHVLARAINLVALEAGMEVGYTSDIPNLLPTFSVFKPSLILSVPRVFEKVFNSARQSAHDGGKGKIFDLAADVAVQYSTAAQNGDVGLLLRAKHAVFDKLVYAKLRAALGGVCELAISGGAPLGSRLGHFFSGVGIPVYEGYGLTETTAAVTVNTPGQVKVGTVGRPIPGNAVRIADDGEILLSGEVVFTGYWRNDEATATAITDGWFHTGDIGALDQDGYLSITGRKKEIIVTAGGKNVSPAPMEDIIRASALVSQAVVVGDQKPFIGALITIDLEAFPAWKERHGKSADLSVADLAQDPDLLAEVQEAVDAANETVSHAETIKKFRILPTDFSEDSGELTPTLKVKRNVVADKWAEEIAAIYRK